MTYISDKAKREAMARLTREQRAQVARAQAEKTLARLRSTERAAKPKKPKDDDKPETYEIDILGLEMQRGSPHWLSGERARRASAGISEKRKKEIRDKHRAKAKTPAK